MRISKNQKRVLTAVHDFQDREGCPPSIADLAHCAPEYVHGKREWASTPVKALEQKGLVEKLGFSGTGGRCYGVTKTGREFIEKQALA